ncbi:MAG TPA: phenylacetate-CoA oxygenase/reductase subunit PaaK [Chitinophagaceae bacterium]|nr:phenylacetate-CoA oxygenase/reductase subunit PaaK [Chitinophagaceae bacterium]
MSTPHFNLLKVKDIRHETNSCISLSLEIPTELKDVYHYEAGQYITFKTHLNNEELRRSYSLCSSPLENDYRVAIKQVEGGKFSNYAATSIKKGDMIEVMTPMGNFTVDIDKNNKKNYMAFVAGSGITPVMSLIKTILALEPNSSFTLVYGNQNLQSIIFKEEIESLKNKYMNRLQVIHILSRERLETEINNGRVNQDKCVQIFKGLIDLKKMNHFFLCGPEEMIMSVKDYLLSQQVDEKLIHFELFTTGIQTARADWKESHQTETEKLCTVTIKIDDRTYDIKLAYGGDNILDAALKSGADLPYACKGGVCCTCRAKVMEGEVEMEVNYALEKDEVEQGFVLTCQAHPKTDKVFIDFDAR